MTEQTTIPVKKSTQRLLRAYKMNHGGTYDEFLRELVENGGRE